MTTPQPGYTGAEEDQFRFNKSVLALSDFWVSRAPDILVKVHERYKRIHPSFPWLKAKKSITSYQPTEEDAGLIKQVNEVIDAAEFLAAEQAAGHIDAEKGQGSNLDTALVCADTLKPLAENLKLRIKSAEAFNNASTALQTLSESQSQSSISLFVLEYDIADEDTKLVKKKEIANAFSDFNKKKAEYLTCYANFVSVSEALTVVEGASGLIYLNHHVYDTQHETTISQALVIQEKYWEKVLARVTVATSPEASEPKQNDAPKAVQTVRTHSKALAAWECKRNLLAGLLTRSEEGLPNFSEEDVRDQKTRIINRVKELEDELTSLGPDASPSLDELTRAEEVCRHLNTRLESLRAARVEAEEERRANRQEAIRSMAPVRLVKLKSQANYLQWRKSHEQLNTHSNPYKKAVAVLESIEDPEAKERVNGLTNYEDIMEVVSSLYAQSSQLIPAYITELRRIPRAKGVSDVGRVFGKIRNIFKIIGDYGDGAMSYITSTVIEDLLAKLPFQQQKEWEVFITEKDVENDDPEDERFTASVRPGDSYQELKNLSPIEITAKNRNTRIYFTKWIKIQERIHNNVNTRMKNAGVSFSEKEKPRSTGGKDKRKASVYTTDARICPACDTTVPHKNLKGFESKSLTSCKAFRELNPDQRRAIVQKSKSCSMCLSPGCSPDKCRIKGTCNNCKTHRHHYMVCQVKREKKKEVTKGSNGAEKAESNAVSSSGSVRLLFGNSKVQSKGKIGNETIFYDLGSSADFCTFSCAKRNGWEGVPTTLHMRRLDENKYRTQRTMEYSVTLIDNKGTRYTRQVYGVNHLSQVTRFTKSELKDLQKKFRIPGSSINNPAGEAGILLGAGSLSLHPKLLKIKDGVALYHSAFGRPYYICGTVSDKTTAKNTESLFVDVNFVDTSKKDFWESWAKADQIGLNTDPKCSNCIKAPPCPACSHLETPMSFKEQEEAELIRANVKVDFDNHKVTASFPWLVDPKEVFAPSKSNRGPVEKQARNLIKSLRRDSSLAEYTSAFFEQVERGAVREVPDSEVEAWDRGGNPVNWVSHHPVLKPSSTSTKIRPVVNSSTRHGLDTLNNCLAKGPTSIANLLHVMQRMRQDPYLLVADVSKAYNNIHTPGAVEQHCRRMLWIHPDDINEENPRLRVFVMMAAAFGDRPSGFYLEYSKECIAGWAAKQGEDWIPVRDAILKNMYIDDAVPSFKTYEQTLQVRDGMVTAFAQLGFPFKDPVIVGPGAPKLDREPESLLGYLYDFKEDTLSIKWKINLSVKRRSARTLPDLIHDSEVENLVLTPGSLLTILASQYDPLGLASCFTSKGKQLLSRIAKKKTPDATKSWWKEPLEAEDQEAGLKYVKDILSLVRDPVIFPRAACKEGYSLRKLYAFSDASSTCAHMVLYGLYEGPEGQKVTSLLGGKSAILHRTLPQHELVGLLAANRLVHGLLRAWEPKDLEEVVIFSDSTCSLDQMKHAYTAKNVFVRNRISQIHKYHTKLTVRQKYYHLPSEHMTPADIGTRDECTPEFLRSQVWLQGPEFLKDVDSFPEAKLVHTVEANQMPQIFEEVEASAVEVSEPREVTHPFLKLLDRTSNLKRAVRAVRIVRKIIQKKSFKIGNSPVTAEEISDSFRDLVRATQEEYVVNDLRVKQLLVFKDPSDGILYTKQRCTPEVMENLFHLKRLPVISPKSRLAELVLSQAHQMKIVESGKMAHTTLKQTIVNSRSGEFGCYIVSCRQRAKSLISRCVQCRKQRKEAQTALMADRKGGLGLPIPEDGAAFRHVTADYSGWVLSRPPRGRQTRGTKHYKQWLLAIYCQETRGVSITPVEGYSKEAFFVAFNTHCARHGIPTSLKTDMMSAFISAAKECGHDAVMEEYTEIFDSMSIEWEFIPAGSQWRNPSESLVKSLKQLTKHIEHHDRAPVLTAAELGLLCANIEEILNRRPLTACVDGDDMVIISPNHLIMGRGSRHAVPGPMREVDPLARSKLIHDLTCSYWKELQNTLAASPHLFKANKWHSPGRLPRVGDVVLVLYQSKLSQGYRTGRILEVLNERTVKVLVSPPQDGDRLCRFKPTKELVVGIQRTVLLYGCDDDV